MTKHQVRFCLWVLMALAVIPVSLFAPGIWTSGSLLFLVFVCAFDHKFRKYII